MRWQVLVVPMVEVVVAVMIVYKKIDLWAF